MCGKLSDNEWCSEACKEEWEDIADRQADDIAKNPEKYYRQAARIKNMLREV